MNAAAFAEEGIFSSESRGKDALKGLIDGDGFPWGSLYGHYSRARADLIRKTKRSHVLAVVRVAQATWLRRLIALHALAPKTH